MRLVAGGGRGNVRKRIEKLGNVRKRLAFPIVERRRVTEETENDVRNYMR
jgi:hypothetical protein